MAKATSKEKIKVVYYDESDEEIDEMIGKLQPVLDRLREYDLKKLKRRS